ncbi:hypothetical protein [Xanthocytophaga agilis]|uniref:Uncharacterized protein n=1 Tax=Xanthocytophaga agilis TaxID=3048010 RepID=A0AAE3R605_9BACT|nr:hypothetical protein [Xanthocytophaga agilis]MDJ1502059.1 hypothetical protein [Xanthocytophaga agilis]
MGYIRNDGRNIIIIRRGIRATASRPYIGSDKCLCVVWERPRCFIICDRNSGHTEEISEVWSTAVIDRNYGQNGNR